MTKVYNQCGKCKEWVREQGMDYFTGIGLVCEKCSKGLRTKKGYKNKIFYKKLVEKEMANASKEDKDKVMKLAKELEKELLKNKSRQSKERKR